MVTSDEEEPWWAMVRFADGRRVEVVRDSHAEAAAWQREQSAGGDVVSMSLLPQRQVEDIQRRLEGGA